MYLLYHDYSCLCLCLCLRLRFSLCFIFVLFRLWVTISCVRLLAGRPVKLAGFLILALYDGGAVVSVYTPCELWYRYIQPSYRLEHMLRTLKDAGKKLFSELVRVCDPVVLRV